MSGAKSDNSGNKSQQVEQNAFSRNFLRTVLLGVAGILATWASSLQRDDIFRPVLLTLSFCLAAQVPLLIFYAKYLRSTGQSVSQKQHGETKNVRSRKLFTMNVGERVGILPGVALVTASPIEIVDEPVGMPQVKIVFTGLPLTPGITAERVDYSTVYLMRRDSKLTHVSEGDHGMLALQIYMDTVDPILNRVQFTVSYGHLSN